uniref:Uncharacterized protein n=1 Tax=Rhizophora mucronata TaxID=61149 RepID=A0A2P2N2N2_RHIMU
MLPWCPFQLSLFALFNFLILANLKKKMRKKKIRLLN